MDEKILFGVACPLLKGKDKTTQKRVLREVKN